MDQLFHHPLALTLLSALLMLFPLMRLYRRVGLSGGYAFLLFFSMLAPMLGLVLALLPLAIQKWPRFPVVPRPSPPQKTEL